MLKKILWAGNIAPIEGSRSRVPEKESGGGGGAWLHPALSSVSRVVRNGPMLGLRGVRKRFRSAC